MKLYDLHAHILPHMDHGCGHIATGVAQLALMQEAGVSVVAATSHFYPQDILLDTFLENRQESLALLLEAYGDKPRPRIVAGAEVLICAGLENMEHLEALCYEGTSYLLLEMPFTHTGWDRSLYHTIHEIQKQGIRPVLAHVDRYPAHLIEGLFEDMGLVGQLNAECLARFVKPKHILRWIENGHIVAWGSDLHGRDPKHYAAYRKIVSGMPDRAETVMKRAERLLSEAVSI